MMNTYTLTYTNAVPDWDSIPILSVNEVQWLPDAGIRMEAQLCYDEEKLYLRERAWERHIRAEHSSPLAAVCEDSCMEFFFCPEGEERYINFECNPKGCLYLGFGCGRNNAVRLLPPTELFSIQTAILDDGWELRYALPLSFLRLFYPSLRFENGLRLRANFYKCGDKTVQPHYLAWNPLTAKTPDFHRPEDFGLLLFS